MNTERTNVPNAAPACTQSNKEIDSGLRPDPRAPSCKRGRHHASSVFCVEGSRHLAKGQWHLGEGSDRFLYPSVPSHKVNGGVATEPAGRRT